MLLLHMYIIPFSLTFWIIKYELSVTVDKYKIIITRHKHILECSSYSMAFLPLPVTCLFQAYQKRLKKKEKGCCCICDTCTLHWKRQTGGQFHLWLYQIRLRFDQSFKAMKYATLPSLKCSKSVVFIWIYFNILKAEQQRKSDEIVLLLRHCDLLLLLLPR